MRKLTIVDPVDEEPRPPEEPVPSFTFRFHDTTNRCRRCNAVYSAESWRLRLSRFRDQMHSGEYLPPSYVEQPTPCPHCEQREHVVSVAKVHNAKQRWDARQRARSAPVHARPRKIALD